MDLGKGLLIKSLRTWVICSECGLPNTKEQSYRNNKTGEIWCNICLAEEKRKRLNNYIRPEDRD